MTVVVKLTPDGKPKRMVVDDVVEFTDKYPGATVEVSGHWVPFEKKYAIVML